VAEISIQIEGGQTIVSTISLSSAIVCSSRKATP
jgi:hypothetical protein